MKAQGTGRKIAVTVWGQRVSPVFDSARTLLIAEIDGNTLLASSRIAFDPERPLELLHLLRAQQVMLIICGAVSEGPAAMIEAAGIELIPFIAGNVHQVLEHYLQGRPLDNSFRMPGCGKNICCRGKIRRGRGIHTLHVPPERMAAEGSPLLPATERTTQECSVDNALETDAPHDKHSGNTTP